MTQPHRSFNTGPVDMHNEVQRVGACHVVGWLGLVPVTPTPMLTFLLV